MGVYILPLWYTKWVSESKRLTIMLSIPQDTVILILCSFLNPNNKNILKVTMIGSVIIVWKHNYQNQLAILVFMTLG